MFNIEGVNWGQLVDYYRRDSYYFGPATQNAWVHGSGVRRYGYDHLRVDPLLVFERMVSGRAVPAKDICFSAPKSVSLLAVLGSESQRKDAIEAHLSAVKMTLDYIESAGFFRVQKKQHGRNYKYQAEGFVVVAVDHLLSREMEPQLHTHALVANIGILPGENRIRSADFKPVYDHQKHLDRVYKGHLQMFLHLRGHALRPSAAGFEMAQVSDDQIEAFSTARVKLDAALRQQGKSRKKSSAVERQRLNKKIRRKKLEVANEEELQRRWQEMARAVELCLEPVVPGSLTFPGPVETRFLVERLVDDCLGRRVTATRLHLFDHVLTGICEAGAIVDPETLRRALEEVLKAKEIFALPGQQVPSKNFLQEELIPAVAIRQEMERLRIPSGEDSHCDFRPNPLKLFLDGLEREVDGSKFLCAMASCVEKWQGRHQAAQEARDELTSCFGGSKKIPSAFRRQMTELQRDVGASFRDELKAARRLQPGADRLTTAEVLVAKNLERWEQMNDELQRKYQADKSRFRTANHEKRLNRNDAWLANQIVKAEKMPWYPEKTIKDLLEDLDQIMRQREAVPEIEALFPAGQTGLAMAKTGRTECDMVDQPVFETELGRMGQT